jgi:predicted unusual protein kinase regulating ubiquinone biosynthesis (AarF/ABC1/UbiB family)
VEGKIDERMKTIDKIPTSKISRISKLVSTGAKVGANYVKYYGKKTFNPDLSRDELNESNADTIYEGLSKLKGSSLKVAQMLSMEKNVLPKEYVEKFSLAQFSVPPMSAPLVLKTLKQYLGKDIKSVFSQFNPEASFAATIGQVHKAEREGEQVAVKIQYPGVADSIESDLAIVKPVAMRMFKLKSKDFEQYFQEVRSKLIEETDYEHELNNSLEIAQSSKHLPDLRFPKYYEELSGPKHLVMEWIDGEHLSEFTKKELNQEQRNKIGQALWDFYMFQLRELKAVHADPHPGNFLVDENENLVALDFGCVKRIPDEFYDPYFQLMDPETLEDEETLNKCLYDLEILRADDTVKEVEFLKKVFVPVLDQLVLPFKAGKKEGGVFDFSDSGFFERLAEMGKEISGDKEVRNMNANRGSRHFLYLNRTFFGLYNLLFDLGAHVEINSYTKFLKS